MNEYEKYRLQWMLDHDYSLPDLLERLSDIAMNENLDEILPAWLLEKCGLSDYTNNSQTVARPDWMEEYEILIDRDNDYVLLRDPDENVNQVWTASGKFLSTVQLENETVVEAMEEYYYNITKGGFYIPDRIKEGYMEEDYDNLSKEDIEL